MQVRTEGPQEPGHGCSSTTPVRWHYNVLAHDVLQLEQGRNEHGCGWPGRSGPYGCQVRQGAAVVAISIPHAHYVQMRSLQPLSATSTSMVSYRAWIACHLSASKLESSATKQLERLVWWCDNQFLGVHCLTMHDWPIVHIAACHYVLHGLAQV